MRERKPDYKNNLNRSGEHAFSDVYIRRLKSILYLFRARD